MEAKVEELYDCNQSFCTATGMQDSAFSTLHRQGSTSQSILIAITCVTTFSYLTNFALQRHKHLVFQPTPPKLWSYGVLLWY